MALVLFLDNWLVLFNSDSYHTNFLPTAELVIPIGISVNEATVSRNENKKMLEVVYPKKAVESIWPPAPAFFSKMRFSGKGRSPAFLWLLIFS